MHSFGRINLVKYVIIFLAVILLGRLYYVQVMRTDEFRDQADRQYVRKSQALYDRGSIYFTTKGGESISAATLATGYTIGLEPRKIDEPEDVFNAISGILTITEKELISKIEADKTYAEIAKRVDEKTAKRIEALELAGVGTYKERWRFYPGGKRGAHILGFVGFGEDGETLSGRYGLERYYDDVLSRDSSDLYVNFFAKIFSNIGKALDGGGSDGDIVTTIEPTVLEELEKKVAGVAAKWRSDLTGGIIMDPSNGEIFAMAVSPSFDPNDFSDVEDSSVFGNPMVDRVYEMGSIIKPLTMAAALDAGAVTADSLYNDAGYVMVNGQKIGNYDGKGRGIVSMQAVLDQSLNTGMAHVAQKLGNDRLTKYFKAFGFGEETGIDLPNETRGLISNLESPRDIEHVTAAFGQGIALTPIETVRALSALGNGGVLPNPHIAKRIDYTTGISKTLTYEDMDKVFEPETSEEITRMLVKVVDHALLGGAVKMDRYSVAAKTGTAQMALESGRGYHEDRYLHSFFGYFPAYEPRFIIFLFTVYPKGAEYASHTLTMPFSELVKFLVSYYDIPPDR